MIEIPLEHHGRLPLYRQIANHLKRMVQNGTLTCGYRLPGSRELASSLGISRATVVLAYDLLEDDGFIEQKGRRGSFVSWKKTCKMSSLTDSGPVWDLASGLPSADLVPWERIASLSRDSLLGAGPDSLYDTPPEGLLTLRKALVRHAARRGIPASKDDAIVTSGARHALSVYIEAMFLKGVRRLWIEELTYPEIRRMAAGAGMEIRTVPWISRTSLNPSKRSNGETSFILSQVFITRRAGPSPRTQGGQYWNLPHDRDSGLSRTMHTGNSGSVNPACRH